MLKRKENNKNKDKKSQLLIVGSLLILLGLGVIIGKIYFDIRSDNLENIALVEFYEEQEEINNNISSEKEEETNIEKEEVKSTTPLDYIAVLKIPSIGLEKGLVSKDSYYNNVNKNIKILDESDMPDEENGNVILAAHSGNGKNAFFKNLNKLKIDNIVSIFYNGYEYRYRMVNTYDVEKTGTVEILRNVQKNTLTLITCRHNTNKQIVIICELVEKI